MPLRDHDQLRKRRAFAAGPSSAENRHRPVQWTSGRSGQPGFERAVDADGKELSMRRQSQRQLDPKSIKSSM